VNVDGDEARAGERRAGDGAASRRHEAVVVGGREQAGEGAYRLAVLGEVQVVAPACNLYSRNKLKYNCVSISGQFNFVAKIFERLNLIFQIFRKWKQYD
jgi:hypothetical protein